jgi:hypothetical protein
MAGMRHGGGSRVRHAFLFFDLCPWMLRLLQTPALMSARMVAGEDKHPQMLQVLGHTPGLALQENIECDERGLAAQLLYLELVQEARPNAKIFPKGSAFELSVADEVSTVSTAVLARQRPRFLMCHLQTCMPSFSRRPFPPCTDRGL